MKKEKKRKKRRKEKKIETLCKRLMISNVSSSLGAMNSFSLSDFLAYENGVEEKILERASFKKDVDAKVIQAGMFNTTATEKMRKDMLQQLLAEDYDEKEEEAPTDDTQINEVFLLRE